MMKSLCVFLKALLQGAEDAYHKLLANVDTYKSQMVHDHEVALEELKQSSWRTEQDQNTQIRLLQTELSEERLKLPRAEAEYNLTTKELREQVAQLQTELLSEKELLSTKLTEATQRADKVQGRMCCNAAVSAIAMLT